MAAIVIYEEANIVAIISILISMLSVASKSFVFSIATALTMKQLFFNWLSGILDFFALFFIVSWVFYEPDDENLQEAFDIIQTVWISRIYICTLPLIFFASMLAYVAFAEEFWPNSSYSPFSRFCGGICVCLTLAVVWICGVVASTLVCEIVTWV